MPTQAQMYYQAEAKSANLNKLFLELVNHPTNPLMQDDLRALIARRPEQYGRFAGFIDQLPTDDPDIQRCS